MHKADAFRKKNIPDLNNNLSMKSMKNSGFAGLALIILMLAGPVLAAPMPQQMIVNNDSM